MRTVSSLAVTLLLACSCMAQTTQPATVADYLQSVSVTIVTDGGQGSGTIVTRGDQTFVLTAAHVIDGLRSTREVVDKKGAKKTVVEFADAKVVKVLNENGRAVGRVEMDAEVLRYSDADTAEDLALLRVRKTKYESVGAKFYQDQAIPPLMTRIVHCGSLLGTVGSNSVTTGIVSQHGRLINGKVFDQVDCAMFPGSSGGGVYTEDGRYVGMIVRGAVGGFGLAIPVRRVKSWADRVGVSFVLDPALPVPDEKALRATPIEDSP